MVGMMLYLFSAAISLQYLIRDSKNRDIALRIASNKVEEYRTLGYASSTSGGAVTDTLLSLLPNGSASSSITTYNAKTKQITVGVSWTGRASSTKYQSVTTLITEIGGL